jgi:PSP1 C-terminal conserved region
MFGASGHSGFPASALARNSIEEEISGFDPPLGQSTAQEDPPLRYADRGRSLSTSAAPHSFRARAGEGDDVTDEVLYEEDEEDELEPLSRSRTLPEPSLTSLGFGTSRYTGLSTDRERLERQRGGPRQSPRTGEEIPPARRQDSFSQASSAWDETRAHRSPPRSVDYPAQSGYESYESGSMVDSPASLQSFPGIRDYPLNPDVQNYFNNDQDRRRIAEQQFQYYQMQNRLRQPMAYPSSLEPSQRSFPFHDPDQYTLHIVKFKANRMDVFYLSKEKKLDLQVKDYVIVDGDRGTDLGMVSKVNVTEAEARSLTAQLQREQAAATAANQNGMNANAMEAIAAAASQVQERDVIIPKKFIHRLAVRGEIDGLQMKMQDEAQAKQVCEMKVQQRGLQMDILDVEYQWFTYHNGEI